MRREAPTSADGTADDISALMRRAVRLHQSGDLVGAAEVYRRVLAIDPDCFDALHLFGLLRHHEGDNAAARPLLERALALRSDNAACRNHLALVCGAQRRFEEALAHLDAALEARPDFAEAWSNRGNALDALGRVDESAAAFERALALNPDAAVAHNNFGGVLAAQGKLDQAKARYQKALDLDPHYAEAMNNLGNLLAAEGEHVSAIGLYRKAAELAPHVAEPHVQLALAFADIGDAERGLQHAVEALRLQPDDIEARKAAVAVLHGLRPRRYLPLFDSLLEDAFGWPGMRHEDLATPTALHLKAKHGLPATVAAAADADLASPSIAAFAADPLTRPFLAATLNLDPALEVLLTRQRRRLLLGDAPGWPLGFRAALARQCANNEHAFAVEDDEHEAVAALRRGIEAADTATLRAPKGNDRLLTYAAYAPLDTLANRAALAAVPLMDWPAPLRPLVADGLHLRAEEARLRETIPALGAIGDETSRAVAAQYEASPYPRWVSLEAHAPRTPARALQEVLPRFAPPAFLGGPVDILVAGCGTGRHPIGDVAAVYKESRVLAIDLSRSSLAYARRMARKHNVANIDFLRADILALGALDRRFHIVECAGVLHHMAEPEAGWRVLVDLLLPGGLMFVGLYSAAARGAVNAARDRVAEAGLAATPDGIRAFRRRVLLDPAFGDLRPLLAWPDFYSTSGCRDLVFHVREHQFTLPQIAGVLERLDLEFLGFQFADQTLPRRYRAHNPDDPAMTDLDAWHRFEAANPNSFAAMYQFWCRRAES